MPDLIARHYETGVRVRISVEGGKIASMSPVEAPGFPSPDDDWVAPGLWDIQTNGRWGVSYSSPSLREDRVSVIVRAQAALGTARLCPTLITAPFATFCHAL